ncbi:MAG: pyridoxal-phosphate dependent enzyme, partial [Sciscionella sp.]
MLVDLSGFPRVELGTWPTPVEECRRLSATLGGPRVLVKRDDVNGLGAGGNKLRKLEYLLGQAMADGADTVLTFGAVQTNHGRQTAAACARLGLRCELVLTEKVARDGRADPADAAYLRSGNVALDRLYGARVHICPDEDAAKRKTEELLAQADAEGRRVATFPIGGSNGLGGLGYVTAAAELLDQVAELGYTADRIVLAQGSGGTAAGLAVGTALLGWVGKLEIACVARPARESADEAWRLVNEISCMLGVEPPRPDHLHWTHGALGPGYGVPTEQVWEALRTFGSTEGIALDPVYTGKAAAVLLETVRTGEIGARETVVF